MSGQMVLTVNGFKETVPADISVSDLIALMKEGDRDLIVELNGRFVYPSAYSDTFLSPQDRVELINPNFGG